MTSPLALKRDDIKAILPKVVRMADPYLGRTRTNAVILVGPPGTGKTSMSKELADELGMPYVRLSSHPDFEATEAFGRYLPIKGEWDFQEGAGLIAWGHGKRGPMAGKPCVICVDDIHNMGPGGMSALYTLLDAGAGATYMHPNGDILEPHEDHVIICTMNGDVDSLDPAVRDRGRVIIPVMEPSTEMLKALRPEIQMLCKVDYDDNPDPVATYREWRSMSDLWGEIGLARAVLLALGTKDRASKMLSALAAVGIKEAAAAKSEIMAAAPSGR